MFLRPEPGDGAGTGTGTGAGDEGERRSEVAAAGLLALDGLEQGLEVALAEPLRAVPLDELEEHRRPVLHRPGKDLEQVAVLVAVGEYAQVAKDVDGHPGVADPLAKRVVVAVRGRQAGHAGPLHVPDRRHDVVGSQRDVLDAWAAVELQVLVDLRLLL